LGFGQGFVSQHLSFDSVASLHTRISLSLSLSLFSVAISAPVLWRQGAQETDCRPYPRLPTKIYSATTPPSVSRERQPYTCWPLSGPQLLPGASSFVHGWARSSRPVRCGCPRQKCIKLRIQPLNRRSYLSSQTGDFCVHSRI